MIWLRKACSKKGQAHYDLVFQSAINELRRTLKVQIEKSRSVESKEQIRMRETLCLSDDEGAPPTKRGRHSPADTVTVSLDGVGICMKTLTRPLMIQATVAVANALIAYCVSHIESGVIALKKDSSSTSTVTTLFQMLLPSREPVHGRVTWHPSCQAWAVHYKDAAGSHLTKRFKMETVRTLISSASTVKEHFKCAQEAEYAKAIEFWNSDDKSTRDRIAVSPAS